MTIDEPISVDLHSPGELPMLGKERFVSNPRSMRVAHIWIALFFLIMLVIIMIEGFHLLAFFTFLGLAGIASAFVELLVHLGREGAITIDYERRLVILEHVVYPENFWDFRAKREVVLPFSSILCVQEIRNSGIKSYFVYTRTSRFSLGRTIDRVDRLAVLLGDIAEGTGPVHPIRNIWVIGFAAGFAGLAIVALLGWLLGWI